MLIYRNVNHCPLLYKDYKNSFADIDELQLTAKHRWFRINGCHWIHCERIARNYRDLFQSENCDFKWSLLFFGVFCARINSTTWKYNHTYFSIFTCRFSTLKLHMLRTQVKRLLEWFYFARHLHEKCIIISLIHIHLLLLCAMFTCMLKMFALFSERKKWLVTDGECS